ncbi:UNVERIFIED_CONTAM: hypothetical protein H355_005056, partial [Colinus virginianus]
ATKFKKSLRAPLICFVLDSVDDMLDGLLGSGGQEICPCLSSSSIPVSFPDEGPAKSSQPAGVSSGRPRSSSLQASKKSFLEDDFFNDLLAEDMKDAEVYGGMSGKNLEVWLVPSLASPWSEEDGMEEWESSTSSADPQNVLETLKVNSQVPIISAPGESASEMDKEPFSSPPAVRQYKKFNFEEPVPPQTPMHTKAPARRREELTFEDDADDLLDVLGFGDSQKGDQKEGKKAENREEVRPARSKLDELLGRGSVTKILEQPASGEHREFKLDKKYEKQPEKKEEDYVFGAYQPTVASMTEGRSSRRQSVRFSAENSSEPKPDPHSKPPPASSQSPARSRRTGGNWLGLKDEDFWDSEPPSPAKTSSVVSTQQLLHTEEATTKPNQLEEENWLSAALSRKKAQAKAKAEEKSAVPLETPGKGLDPSPPVCQPATSTGAALQAAAQQDKAASTDNSGPCGIIPSKARDAEPCPTCSAFVSLQVTTPSTPLQAASQLQAESSPLGSLHERKPGAHAAQPYEDEKGCWAALLSAQARVAELEGQVRMLELERTQHKLLLESLQQRHQDDLDLLESTHRSRLKMVEETYGQREERLRREKEQLEERLLSQSQDAERARADLVAQHKQHVATLEKQKAQELERLQELQRSSVQEMRKDHEEQLQRLRQLKDQEIAAVTSATSHTRSLNGVIEQMERFSSDLHNLSHKVEAAHHTTSQELAMGARQRDEQLKPCCCLSPVLQDRLSQQQRDMEEERSRLQEVIAKMEARLSEQTRLLEQERWKAMAEQSKVESLQRSLEEQRRVMTQQLSMERAELERAKSALLEEQKSVMQKCSEERRKLAVEWAEFHTQQQLSKERIERDIDRALQLDSQREGTIMSLAKEQAELKIWNHDLKFKEEQLVRDRELLDEAWRELRLEKDKVKRAALRVRQQEEEVKNMSNISAQKYEKGEQALQDACRIESEHQARLQVMQQHLEQLKQQEQHLQQERLNMAHQSRQLEQLHKKLLNNPTLLLNTDQDLGASTRGLSSTLSYPPPIRTFPGHRSVGTAAPTEFYTKLLLLKLRAQQDRSFLEDEQLFLETLKKASYNTSPLSV